MTDRKKQHAPLGEIFTRNFLILSTINLAVFFGFQMINIGLPVYMAQLGAEAHVVGLATTLMTVTATLMRVLAGALLDRFGRMGMLIGGTAVIMCAIMAYAVFPIVGIILGLRLLHGIGWGLGSTASSTIAADIIPKHRFAEGMGYFAMTTAIASALAPAASVELVQGAGATTMIYVAFGITAFAFLLSIIQAVLLRRDGRAEARGEGGAAQAAGQPAETGSSRQDNEHDVRGAEDTGATEKPAPFVPTSKLETLFERRAAVPGILILLVNIGFGCITTFIALHAQERGVSGVSAYFLVYAIVTLASRPYIGKLIDRYGYRMPAILSTLCTAGTLAFIGASGNIAMFAVSGILGGLGLGTAMGTFQAMAVASVEPWRRGVATSTYMVAFDMGIAIGSLAGGVIAGALGYAAMYYIMALFPLMACGASLFIIKQ